MICLNKHAGIPVAYSLLVFVSLYYFISSPRQTGAICRYLRHRRKQGFLRSLINTYRNYFVFGQTIIDKIRSEEHTSELQSLIRSSYAAFCMKKTKIVNNTNIRKS